MLNNLDQVKLLTNQATVSNWLPPKCKWGTVFYFHLHKLIL